jgi:hypothetical protein
MLRSVKSERNAGSHLLDSGRLGADWIAVRCQCNAARKRTFVLKYRYDFRTCFVSYVTERSRRLMLG